MRFKTVKAAKRRHKRVYTCTIDASKAFGKVDRPTLYSILIEIIPNQPWLVRSIMLYYDVSAAYADNCKIKSERFVTSIGVKQGGCLNPLLFSIYFDSAADEIDKLNVRIGNMLVSILMYADDIFIMSETSRMLKMY